ARPSGSCTRTSPSEPWSPLRRNASASAPLSWSLLIDDFTGALGEAHFPVAFDDLEADPCRLVLFRIEMGHVGNVDRGFLLDDTALRRLRRTGVPLHHIDALNDDAVFLGQRLDDFASAALVAARQNDHAIALFDLELGHHSTSGASETIFMNFLPRSS